MAHATEYRLAAAPPLLATRLLLVQNRGADDTIPCDAQLAMRGATSREISLSIIQSKPNSG